MSKLVVISNRVMSPNFKKKESSGGLIVAIDKALKKSGGIWIGWSGDVKPENHEKHYEIKDENVNYITLDLTKNNYENFYNGYCNDILWPLFHYRLDLINYSKDRYLSYKKVNILFAEKVVSFLSKDDLLWVHDYHFMLLAKELRKRKCTQKLGFFLHVPWPSREVLMVLPDHYELVSGLLDYDIIGFQTKNYALAFLDYIVRELNGNVEPDGFVYALGKRTRVQHFPISIETDEFSKLSSKAKNSNHIQRLVKSLGEEKLIVGVDRLDYSKGLIKRFQTYEHLLKNYPANIKKTTFLHISPTSRGDVSKYKQLRRDLETKAGHINGTFADFDWTPIRYLNKGFSRQILSGFFRRSQIGLVTPLRDGMNLVAKEYVASQSHENPGVLILSIFAGSAEELDGAILVNPYDIDEMANAIDIGLKMNLDERISRWSGMIDRLQSHDIDYWAKQCIQAIRKVF